MPIPSDNFRNELDIFLNHVKDTHDFATYKKRAKIIISYLKSGKFANSVLDEIRHSLTHLEAKYEDDGHEKTITLHHLNSTKFDKDDWDDEEFNKHDKVMFLKEYLDEVKENINEEEADEQEGGRRRRKTRKSKKSKKARKTRKH